MRTILYSLVPRLIDSIFLHHQPLGSVPAACAGEENVEGGYNSEDEYSHIGVQLTEEEWQEKDRRFERLIKKKKGQI